MTKTALIVIDMQQDMADRLAAGRDAAPDGVPERIAALLARARAAGVPVLHVHHDDPDPTAAIRLDRLDPLTIALAQTQRESGREQGAIGRIEIAAAQSLGGAGAPVQARCLDVATGAFAHVDVQGLHGRQG